MAPPGDGFTSSYFKTTDDIGNPFKSIGEMYYDENTKELFWRDHGIFPTKSDKIGTFGDIDEALKNVKVVITKKSLNGDL